MKRTEVVREAADALHQAEAAIEAAVAEATAALERLALARKELGLTGTVGDAMIARVTEAVETLKEGRETFYEGHQEAYGVYQMLNLRDAHVVATIRPYFNTASASQVA